MTPIGDPAGVASEPDGFVARADAGLTRVGLTTPLRRDGAFALLMAVVTLAVTALALADPVLRAALGPPLPAVLALLAVQAGVLTVRRVDPVLCVGLVVALQVALGAVVPPDGWLRGPAPVIAAYTCGAWLPARRAMVVAVVAAAAETFGFVGLPPVPAPDVLTFVLRVVGQFVSALITYVGATLLGGYVATRRRYAEMGRLRTAEALEAQRARTEAAVGAERTRMARELHDIAAHHLAAMVVQASMAERLIDRDPEAARRTVGEVRAQGRATLQDLRLVVGALRERGVEEIGEGEPVPGLAVLDRLVANADGRVGLDVVGTPRELSPVADVSFYRVAQEALSNARDHAPGAEVSVRVEYADTATVLEVRNGPAVAPPEALTADRGPGRGLGLVGMRERAELIGAALDVGPWGDGGWRVRLELPRTAGSDA